MKSVILLLAGLVFIPCKNQSQTVADYDGNLYDTVIMGPQVWLKENLRVTHYNNGAPIPNVISNTSWASMTMGARCYYNNDSAAFDSVYGPLYNWYAVNDNNKICPDGWHASTNAEWIAAESYLGGAGIAGGKMKETGTMHWASPNTGATNSTGFTGLPGGMRDPANNFQFLFENGLWWTSTSFATSMAWSTYQWYLYPGADHNPVSKKSGFSVRCVKDIATGLGDHLFQGNFKLHPNPAIGRITIECAEYQDTNLMVYDLFGELVVQGALTERTNDIDISSLPKGVYMLKITGVRGTMQQKLIKE